MTCNVGVSVIKVILRTVHFKSQLDNFGSIALIWSICAHDGKLRPVTHARGTEYYVIVIDVDGSHILLCVIGGAITMHI